MKKLFLILALGLLFSKVHAQISDADAKILY